MSASTPTQTIEETTESRYDQQRECTRCDGQQHLVGSFDDFGKYRCDTCELTIGFDVSSNPAEFIINRGLPGRYTKNIFGSYLKQQEQRF